MDILFWALIIWALYHLIKWLRTRQKRYIPREVKNAVLKRYFNMCAVCMENTFLEFHHRKPYSDNGDNSEQNIVPLCPKHHAMVTRYTGDKFE
ncbi:MAG: HNH endonuclease [Candidatus Aenigmarchaeota archaeon]|nr:HNH endonuclease [Candidatus Aenigmarchaeota archaeon]